MSQKLGARGTRRIAGHWIFIQCSSNSQSHVRDIFDSFWTIFRFCLWLGGFHSHGGTPMAMDTVYFHVFPGKSHLKMDEKWWKLGGYPHDLRNPHDPQHHVVAPPCRWRCLRHQLCRCQVPQRWRSQVWPLELAMKLEASARFTAKRRDLWGLILICI